MAETYKILVRYGKIIADKQHETTEGNFIRFTTFEYQGFYYIAVICNGAVMAIAEKDDMYEAVEL